MAMDTNTNISLRMQTHTLHYIAFHSIPFRTVPYHAVPCRNIHPSVRPSIHTYIHLKFPRVHVEQLCCHGHSSTTTERMFFSSKPPEVNP